MAVICGSVELCVHSVGYLLKSYLCTMGTSLAGLLPQNTYSGLIKFGDNAALSASLKAISDGAGNDTMLSISTTALQIGGATGLNWDNTNKRLGVGTDAPNAATTINTNGAWAQGFSNNLRLNAESPSLQLKTTAGNSGFMIGTSGPDTIFASSTASDFSTLTYNAVLNSGNWGFGGYFTPTARLQIKGSGSTSATTSLLVQNSSGTDMLSVNDIGQVTLPTLIAGVVRTGFINTQNNAFSIMQCNGTTGNAKFYQFVSIGTSSDPVASAALDVVSTTKGFLPPRMTDAQRAAIASPAEGLILFNTDNKGVAYRDGTNWGYLSGAPQTVAASGGTVNVSFASGNIVDMTLTASTTLTFAGHVVGTYIFELTQGGSGSYTITWPASVKWSGGTAPTLTTTVGKTDIVTLFHDGTNFYGTYSLNY